MEASASRAGEGSEVREQMRVTVLAVLCLWMRLQPMLFFLFHRCLTQAEWAKLHSEEQHEKGGLVVSWIGAEQPSSTRRLQRVFILLCRCHGRLSTEVVEDWRRGCRSSRSDTYRDGLKTVWLLSLLFIRCHRQCGL